MPNAEVLIPMGTFTAYAGENLTEGQLFKWSTSEKTIVATGSGERPVGIVIRDITAGELCNDPLGGAAEFFKTAGIVKVPVTASLDVGGQVMSDASGAIAAYVAAGTNHAFGVVLSTDTETDDDGNAVTVAELYIY